MRKLLLVSSILIGFYASCQQKWSLQQCIDYAMKNNLQVLQNSLNKNMQERNLDIAKREKWPSVSGTFNSSSSFGQGQDVFGNMKRNDNFNSDANLGANILIYNNGKLEKNIKKTQYDVEASQYDLEAVRSNISLQIIQQYLDVLLNKEIYKINKASFENATQLYNRAKITTEVGTTPQTVLAEAHSSLSREKQNVKNAEIGIKRTLFTLSQTLLLPDYKGFDIEDISIPNEAIAEFISKENILEKAYEVQPQIKAAISRINSAKAQTEIAKTVFFPTITANAGIGTFYFNSLNEKESNDFFQQYKNNFGQQLSISANIPIFNKGITKLQVEQAKINEEIAKNLLDQQKQEIKQNVQKAQFDAEANYQIYLSATEAEKSTKLALDFAEKSYAAGKTTIYDLNIARNNYANAQGSTAQAKYNYLFSQKVLDFYTGNSLNF